MTNVLIIEDDVSMRSLLKTLLEIENFQVSVLNLDTNTDIFSQIISSEANVILMDVNLKKADGLSILRQIRQKTAGEKTFYVIMTSGEDRKQECLLAGADDFLLKPYMPAELIQKLRSIS